MEHLILILVGIYILLGFGIIIYMAINKTSKVELLKMSAGVLLPAILMITIYSFLK